MKKWAPFWASFLPALLSPALFLERSTRPLYDAFVLILIQWLWIAPIAAWIALICPRPHSVWGRVALGIGLGIMPLMVRWTLRLVGSP